MNPFLDYILRNNKARPDDFNSTQQVKFWTDLGSVKAGHLLKQYGFNVNIRDHEGYTPLLRMIKETQLFFLKKLGICAHVSTLLNCGADRSAIVFVGGIGKNAIQLNTNPALNTILQQV